MSCKQQSEEGGKSKEAMKNQALHGAILERGQFNKIEENYREKRATDMQTDE